MTADFPQRVLFPVLRAGLDLADAVPELSEEDAALLLPTAARQELLPIVYRAFSRCAPAHPLTAHLRDACEKGALRYLMLEQALDELCALFDRERVPYLPLKGAVLRRLYPEPWLRTSSDIDVLVPETELDRAASLLTQAAGYTVGKRSGHDLSLLGPKAHVELHFLLNGGTPASDELLGEVWSYASAADGGCRYAMAPEFELTYLLAHMSRHLRLQGIGVRPLIDVWLLCRARQFDGTLRAALLEWAGLTRFFEAVCALTAVWFEGAAHTELTAALEAFCLEGGVFGSAESTIYARQHETGVGAAYLRRRFFLPRAQLEEYYPQLREKPGRLPYYQVKRWFRAATKGPKRILREQKMIKAGAEQAAAVDALLAELGF